MAFNMPPTLDGNSNTRPARPVVGIGGRMSASAGNVSKIVDLQRHPSRIRNVCILAHVDHGKTTLADSLVASNGIISNRMAGKLRYMDSREDEQEKGITMKSSAVSLYHVDDDDREFLVNLIDSPGHVDFSSEVSTAVRLCDGAVVLVDVVEGVQPQTKVVLQQAWQEGIKPILVLNKLDRLITELKLDPLSAYVHLSQILEQVNAIIAELFTSGVMTEADEKRTAAAANNVPKTDEEASDDDGFDWSAGLDEADDSDIYFSPDVGNVAFASAYDGWAFDLASFAKIYAQKLGFSERVLTKTLWGDFYVNMKAKKILRGAMSKGKQPLFVQLILANIWAVYEAAVERRDKEKLQKIVDSLSLKVAARDLRSNDPRHQLNAVMSQWLPVAPCVLKIICAKHPSPDQLSPEKVEKLMCSKSRRFDALPEQTQKLKGDFLRCSSSDEAPTIVFVSKMFPVPRKDLPESRLRRPSEKDVERKREITRLRHAVKEEKDGKGEEDVCSELADKLAVLELEEKRKNDEEERLMSETTFIAFTRVFSGVLTPGKEVYVLGPKHEPSRVLELIKEGKEVCDQSVNIHTKTAGNHIMKTTVDKLYLLLGKDLEELSSAPAGNVVGISGLQDFILKSATLSSDMFCPAFIELSSSAVPILRVAVEPALSVDVAKMVHGLHLLNQADANVEVLLTDKGEHILVTAGEVHLERCLRDLTTTYAGVEVNASSPIVPFRETVVAPPKTDMVNEQLNDENKIVADDKEDQGENKSVVQQTPDKRCSLTIRALPLPPAATKLLEENAEVIRALEKETSDSISGSTLEAAQKLRSGLTEALNDDSELSNLVNRICSFGPRKCGPNLLVNNTPDESRFSLKSAWPTETSDSKPSFEFSSSLLNGFQLATLAGPLCEEPMMGVAFVLDDCLLEEEKSSDEETVYGPLSGQVVSAMKEGCRRAFQSRPQRLMAAMYSCEIQVKVEVLGKLYASLGKRQGKVVYEEMIEGSSTFNVTAHLPVIESFQFAQEIRHKTSGLAMPQLVFSHWEVVEMDPFWVPQTEEEILHFGEKADSENHARRYMNDVRKKKGLAIDEKIVEFAEKQRTLTKMK